MASRAMHSAAKRNRARDFFARRMNRGNDSCERDIGCAVPKPAFATMEEVRHAHDLRLRLRARFLSHVVLATGPWSVGVD